MPMAFEFGILTAARLGEVLGAQWTEIDLTGKGLDNTGRPDEGWPCAPRSSGGPGDRDCRAYGRDPEQAISFSLAKGAAGRCRRAPFASFVPAPGQFMASGRAFAIGLAKRHRFPREISEHVWRTSTGNAVEQAYRRGDALEKRRPLMEAWAQYCEPSAGGNCYTMTRASN